MRYRGVIIHPDELSEYWADLLLDSSVNLLGIHPVGGLTGGGSVSDSIGIMQQPDKMRLLYRLQEHGISIEYYMHALSWLLPRDLLSRYPDWFRMDNEGNRVNDYNICVSSTDALDYISEHSVKLAGLCRPTTGRHHFWTDDVGDARCRCPGCSQLSAADYTLRIYNAIARGIKVSDSGAVQSYLAYHDTMAVPERTEREDNVYLEYAPMERDMHIPLSDTGCEKNVREIHYLKRLVDFFGTENSTALDYWLDNSYFSGWKKPVMKFTMDKDLIAADIAFYDASGFDAVTTFACYLGKEYKDLYGEVPDIKGYGKLFPDKQHDRGPD
ncbi:MAG: DUF4838 domain-containing protein [Saccharofermentanales bacterium]